MVLQLLLYKLLFSLVFKRASKDIKKEKINNQYIYYMSIELLRTLRLKSVEQGVWTPQINRVSFDLPPDVGVNTVGDQCYLEPTIWIVDKATGVPISSDDFIEAFDENRISVALGNDKHPYPPSALIATAKLYTGQSRMLKEEINFLNVLTSTLHQYINDFETIQSNTLLSGTVNNFLANSPINGSITLINNPTTLQIPMRDIFGTFRTPNLHIDALNGVHIELLLEQRNNLFMTVPQVNTSLMNFTGDANVANWVMPVDFSAHTILGFTQTPETSQYQSNCIGQNTDSYVSQYGIVDTSGTWPKIASPDGYRFPAPDYVTTFFLAPVAPALVGVASAVITLTPLYTAAMMTALGFVAGAVVKLNFTLTLSGKMPKQLERLCAISSVTAAAGATKPYITLDESFQKPILYTGESLVLDSFEIVKNSVPDLGNGTPLDATSWNTLASNNTLRVAIADIGLLQDVGVLNIDGEPTDSYFSLAIKTQNATPSVTVWDDVITGDGDSMRLYSNQSKRVPVGGGTCKILEVNAISGSTDKNIVFSSLGLENTNGLQFNTVYVTGASLGSPVITYPDATTAVLYLYDVKPPVNILTGAGVVMSADQLTWQIDKFELVLVQQIRNPEIPMSDIYTTWVTEAFTIEYDVTDYSKQFTLGNPSTTNLFLCTPDLVGEGDLTGSLISTCRGINSYRWLVNNEENTNRDIIVQTYDCLHPSSLAYDKLLDMFNNTDYQLRSLAGINGISHDSTNVCAFPLRLYTAMDGNNYYTSDAGSTAQIQFHGDNLHDMYIRPGMCYLFKQVIRKW